MNLPEKIEHYTSQVGSISETILNQIKDDESDWDMPWHNGLPEAWNPVTGKFYGGNNFLILWNEYVKNNYPANHWATFKQWQRKQSGVSVKKGEEGTLVMFAIPKTEYRKKNNLGADAQLDFEFTTKEEREEAEKNYYFRYYWVFNAGQVEGYDIDQADLFTRSITDTDRIKEFVDKTGAEIKRGGNRAFYSIVEDFIQIPEIKKFKSVNGKCTQDLNYYSTLLHEIIHWTAHDSRCARQFKWKYGENAYIFEELVAEIGTGILTTQFNTHPIPRKDHAIHCESWLQILKNDFSYFTEALEQARAAIYWLYKETDILPYDLKPQYTRTLSENKVKGWEKLI